MKAKSKNCRVLEPLPARNRKVQHVTVQSEGRWAGDLYVDVPSRNYFAAFTVRHAKKFALHLLDAPFVFGIYAVLLDDLCEQRLIFRQQSARDVFCDLRRGLRQTDVD